MPLDARCEPHLESDFRAQAGFSELGLVQVAVLTATPLSIHRTPKLIRRSDPETFMVTCTVRGRVWGEQDGRHAELHVGDLSIRDSSHPSLTRMAPSERPRRCACSSRGRCGRRRLPLHPAHGHPHRAYASAIDRVTALLGPPTRVRVPAAK
ncbi:hypothetical protein [Nonomuraea mesophila]|uniref:AraC-like ligand-binding domain-containing protein n=1 Tax=Nonomuraea mesophila TaxID=2530382 RepID=UPI00140CF5AF